VRGLEVSFAGEVCARATERVLVLEYTATREMESMQHYLLEGLASKLHAATERPLKEESEYWNITRQTMNATSEYPTHKNSLP